MYIRFCAALVLAASLAFGQNIDSTRLRYTNPATGGQQRTVQSRLSDEYFVKDFGAKCDGSTDDSTSLQAAITATQTARGTLLLPPGTCSFNSTLNLTGLGYITIRGAGSIGSVLQYTGAGTAITANTGAFMYRVFFRDFRLVSTGAAQYGVYAKKLEESGSDNFGVGDNGSGFSVAGVYLAQSGLIDINRSMFSNNTVGIQLDSIATGTNGRVNIIQCNLFNNSVAGIKAGDTTDLNIRNNWFESNQYGLLIDDATTINEAVIVSLLVDGNHCNGANLSQQRFLKVNHSTGSTINIIEAKITNNLVNLQNSSYTVEFSTAGASGRSTRSTFERNTLWGGATAGITANDPTNWVYLRDNDVRSSYFGSTVASTSGTGSFFEADQLGGTIAITGYETITGNLTANGTVTGGALSTTGGITGGSLNLGTGAITSGVLSATSGNFSGQVYSSSGGFKFPDNTTQTSAGIQPSATVISTNTAVSSSGSKNQSFMASGNITVTLYAASAVPGGSITVKKTDSNATSITISSAGGTMDGQSSIVLARQYDAYTFVSDGTNWNIE